MRRTTLKIVFDRHTYIETFIFTQRSHRIAIATKRGSMSILAVVDKQVIDHDDIICWLLLHITVIDSIHHLSHFITF